ncbi:vomeronasal type-2 receptor 1-like [Gracilinanus agilis]|uniref:vomeronasal type-2 receptor 1-like n=1 Tax=Gracilinanus agilis TaxID=191870 RepID=UPI001CFDC9BF|nr:vomeronasal type-2 receptor 1-like [Gracilinanus agilis]
MVQSFVFTIEEINKNPELLPNFTLGFSIWDSGSSELGALWGMMALVTGQGRPIPNYACAPPEAPLAAILGEDRSALSIPMATWLGLYRTPQVSYGSTVSVLSDKRRFPSFLRTLPPDEARARGMALLAARLACYEVGLVAQEDEYGQRGERALRPELEAAGLCVYVTAELPSAPRVDKLQEAIRTLTVAQPRVLLVFSGAHEFLLLAAELHKEPASRLWICSEVWDPAAVPVMLPELAGRQALHGALAFSGHRGCIPGFADFLGRLHPSRASEDQFLVPFWEETFGCRWLHNSSSSSSAGRGRAPGGLLRGQEGSGGGQEEREEGRRGGRGAEADSCTGEERLGGQALPFLDMSDLSVTYAVANAVSSVAHALHDMAACEAGDGPFGDGRCADMPHFQPWQSLGLFLYKHSGELDAAACDPEGPHSGASVQARAEGMEERAGVHPLLCQAHGLALDPIPEVTGEIRAIQNSLEPSLRALPLGVECFRPCLRRLEPKELLPLKTALQRHEGSFGGLRGPDPCVSIQEEAQIHTSEGSFCAGGVGEL